MKKYFGKGKIRKNCKLYGMLSAHARGRHISFHTPGHKSGRWDITELSFSDNLSCPRGCIAEAEKDIAEILGAARSFILTDGSTAGVLSVLYAAKAAGVRRIAVCESAHKSFFNGCAALGLTPLVYPQKREEGLYAGIPVPDSFETLYGERAELLDAADALFFTSPDYYGNIADMQAARRYCDGTGKLLLIDGAHGGHLHFDRELYAGTYADLWVDGVHKSLPAFTQGAVASARTAALTEKLRAGADVFRTTSPSYPIMASVEYAVKYPRNTELENAASRFIKENERIYCGGDWTKLCAVFGEYAVEVQRRLEREGIFAEFCDGNAVAFYLSPATSLHEFRLLKKRLEKLFVEYPIRTRREYASRIPAPVVFDKTTETEWVEPRDAEGRICAAACGLFPPCTPLISVGERIEKEKIRLLESADNVFGLVDGKISVFKSKKEE